MSPNLQQARRFHALPLRVHPTGTAGPVDALSASGSIDHSGRLSVEFELRGNLQAIRLAEPAAAPARRDELWRRTCFEVFARPAAAHGYLEFNLAPSGDWAAYRFESYRAGRNDFDPQEIAATTRRAAPDRWLLCAQLAPLGAASALNLAAVIEALDGSLSYWALQHPRAQPDFHDFAGFWPLPGAAHDGHCA